LIAIYNHETSLDDHSFGGNVGVIAISFNDWKARVYVSIEHSKTDHGIWDPI